MYYITDNDAVSDGTTRRIPAIPHTVDACAGEGRVILPAGTLASGAIFFRNNTIAFHRSAGTILPGSALWRD